MLHEMQHTERGLWSCMTMETSNLAESVPWPSVRLKVEKVRLCCVVMKKEKVSWVLTAPLHAGSVQPGGQPQGPWGASQAFFGPASRSASQLIYFQAHVTMQSSSRNPA